MTDNRHCARTGAVLPPGAPEPPFTGWHFVGASRSSAKAPKNPAQTARKEAQQNDKGMKPGRLLLCDYCNCVATFCPSSAHVYHGRNYGPIWHCAPCGAWVGCHKGAGGTRPKGSLANAPLRAARQRAHAAFDPIWQAEMELFNLPKPKARGQAYAWLAREMGLHTDDCHIGMFDEAMCARVIAVCGAFRDGKREAAE